MLAAALAAQLKNPALQTRTVLATLAAGARDAGRLGAAALHQPDTSGYLTRDSARRYTSAAAPRFAGCRRATAAHRSPPSRCPADGQMSDGDRRLSNARWVKLGYYDGQVDGVFGPDTRAAIRRYQHELGAPMTGKLTPAQATKLARSGQ